jgi:16S rRNA A1518/A1519 N6-dimethyltransferase RsmA/KsgA/DIM1 with predicted DNA glycosylase/AP lyase activity
MPSSKKARKAMLQLVHETEIEAGSGAIFELGSGWGNLLIPLAKAYPQRKIVGYELSFIPWLSTIILKRILGLNNIQVLRQDFLQADLNSASLILCYLFPRGMLEVQSKLDTENGQLEYLVSNNFSLPSHKPSKIIRLNDLYKSPVYLYKFKGSE